MEQTGLINKSLLSLKWEINCSLGNLNQKMIFQINERRVLIKTEIIFKESCKTPKLLRSNSCSSSEFICSEPIFQSFKFEQFWDNKVSCYKSFIILFFKNILIVPWAVIGRHEEKNDDMLEVLSKQN